MKPASGFVRVGADLAALLDQLLKQRLHVVCHAAKTKVRRMRAIDRALAIFTDQLFGRDIMEIFIAGFD